MITYVHRMELHQLKYFVALVQTGNMRKASEILHVSQPALSKSLKKLQEELGIALVSYVGRNIVLTDQGHFFADRAKDIIRQTDNLQKETEEKKKTLEEFKVATFEVFSTYALEFLKFLDWKDMRLTFHDLIPGDLERAVLERKADCGVTYLPVPHPELEHIKFATIEMGVFCHRSAFSGVAQNDLPFVVPVLPISGTPSRLRGLDGWPDDAYPRKVRFEVALLETALELCRQGRAAGYFPVFIVENHNKRMREDMALVRKPSPYKGRVCKTDVFLVKRRGDLEGKQIRDLTRALRKVVSS